MKKLAMLIMAATCLQASAQEVAKTEKKCVALLPLKGAVTATIAVGFVDYYRHYYSIPSGFEQSNTSGFTPLYAKVEYGITEHVGLAGSFGYDAFVYNYNQLYDSYNGIIRRYRTDRFRLLSGGLAVVYHFKPLSAVPHLHPFIGAGFAVNNIRHSAFPQGDSTVVWKEHTVSPTLKAGVRYYISDQFSVYGDVGCDKQSIFSLGFSCTFFSNKCKAAKN
jgi:hypothetical protein